ncbi:MAG: F0F1 ATP synthase subunit A [Candidatus Levybacteria bacterium]|nr:F0F1 ATP synthase subunit A [Candidatus Levybacteria bacterium]
MAALAPEILLQIGPVPITNTLLNTALVDVIIVSGVIAINKNLKKIPGIFQNIVELVVDGFHELVTSIAGEKNTKKIFPFFITFFLFILIANWSGLIPGAESLGLMPNKSQHHASTQQNSHDTAEETQKEEVEHEIVSFNRNLTSDLNATLALAIISLVATHTLSIKALGIKEYLGRFFSLNPILLFVGILEIISEFTKIISLSFRLFGNIFAGEVVLGTISKLFAFIFPLPFISLEIIVGLVQALVFSMLTMVFMSVLMTSHHQNEHTAKEVSH